MPTFTACLPVSPYGYHNINTLNSRVMCTPIPMSFYSARYQLFITRISVLILIRGTIKTWKTSMQRVYSYLVGNVSDAACMISA